jgi:hypothetical protein
MFKVYRNVSGGKPVLLSEQPFESQAAAETFARSLVPSNGNDEHVFIMSCDAEFELLGIDWGAKPAMLYPSQTSHTPHTSSPYAHTLATHAIRNATSFRLARSPQAIDASSSRERP